MTLFSRPDCQVNTITAHYMVHYTIDWKRFFGLNGSRYFEKYLEIQESEHPKIYAIDSLVSDLNPSSSVEFRQF